MATIDEKVRLEVSEDKMTAHVIFEEPKDGGELLTRDQILDALKNENVVYGIDDNLVNFIEENRSYEKKYLVARGIPGGIGQDGHVAMLFDTSEQSLKPKVLEDGTVDYRNLNNVKMVKEGEILARIEPPKVGESGRNVYDEEIPGKEGKVVAKIPKGKGVKLSDDGTELISEATGKIIYVDNKISVSEVNEISGDVGLATGNINFNGTVKVQGNVLTDFSIKATGNVEIFGVVEGADIYAGGNILVSKGIAGMNKAFLQAGGNISAKTIQDAKLQAGQDVFAEAIMHSKVKARGKIEIKGKKGLLVGGKISCYVGIDAKTIGSSMGTKTDIKIAVDASALEEYSKLTTELEKIQENYDQNIRFLNSMLKKKDTVAGKKEIKLSLLNTVNSTKVLKSRIQKIKERIEELLPLIRTDHKHGVLAVEKIVHPGISLQIGTAIMTIGDDIHKSKFRNVDGVIKVSPFAGK